MSCANVIDFKHRVALDAIKGRLAPLCATIDAPPEALTMAAQHVFNALHAKLPEVDAYAEGVRYMKQAQAYRQLQIAKQAKRLSDAVRKPLSLDSELAAVDAAFSPEVA